MKSEMCMQHCWVPQWQICRHTQEGWLQSAQLGGLNSELVGAFTPTVMCASSLLFMCTLLMCTTYIHGTPYPSTCDALFCCRTHHDYPLVDPDGKDTKNVHVFGEKWLIQGDGYTAEYFTQGR